MTIMLELDTTEQTKLLDLERKIEAGLQTFVEVGLALMEIRDSKLYRQWHGTFEDYLATRWPDVSRRRAYQLMETASVVRNITDDVKNFSHRESHVAPLVNLQPEQQREAYNEAVATAANGKVTAAHVATVARRYVAPATQLESEDDESLDELTEDGEGYDWTDDKPHHVNVEDEWGHVETVALPPESIGDEYYTPPYILDAARMVLGVIDLDPASSDKAQTVVMANEYYTKDDNGLAQTWSGKVWLNPPFSAPKPFIDKLIAEYTDGNIDEAIILVNNSTETAWGQSLLTRFPVCFVGFGNGRGTRISFWNDSPDNPEKGNRYAQMIFYLGDMPDRFHAAFSQFGAIMEPK